LQRERSDRLAALARMLRTLGPNETLARGFAIIRDGEGRVLQRARGIASGQRLEIQFADDRVNAVAEGGAVAEGEATTGAVDTARSAGKPEPAAKAKAPAKTPEKNSKQGSLF
ncbi:MAG TPA: exodeoxyribonuclease VII large subunit, partial [Paracoccaceae bacterium]|nr:exodeoxyribonuclease VII large subunit [Paracoccaceae bacterium]